MADRKDMRDEIDMGKHVPNVPHKLSDIMAKQHHLMVNVYDHDPENMTTEDREEHTLLMIHAMCDELSELRNEINWKPWKDRQPVDMLNLQFEIIDLLHFWVEIALLWGMTARDVHRLYCLKHEANVERQKKRGVKC